MLAMDDALFVLVSMKPTPPEGGGFCPSLSEGVSSLPCRSAWLSPEGYNIQGLAGSLDWFSNDVL
jgi:hypothetical protein